MTARTTHDVVICTMDRPDDLARCLASLATQTRAFGTVVVVDASAGDATEAIARAEHPGLHVRYLRASPGLTRQRNLGLAECEADVVHFFDDDVVLDPGYLDAVAAVYDADPDGAVVGASGLPTNLPPHRRSRLQSLVAPRSLDQGRVLASGRAIQVREADDDLEVDHLSGCCMSFRRAVAEAEPFDEGLSGYALGEDQEMSYRARQRGRLVVTPRGRLLHLESPINRWARRRWARVDVVNRHRRVRTGIGRYRPSAFWADTLAQLALWTARSALPGQAQARQVARGLAEGLALVLRGGGATDPGPAGPGDGRAAPTVGLYVICHERPAELAAALASTRDEPWHEVLVADMASTPPLDPPAGVRWLRSDENLGVAGGRNLLARHATADVLVFLDDDAVFRTPVVAPVLDRFSSDARLAVVGFRIVRADGAVVSREIPFRGKAPDADTPREAAYFLGGAHAIRREAMLAVGGYDERFFYDGEETDLSLALVRAGHRLWYEPAVVVEHRPAAAGRVVSPRVPALTWRNRVLIARRHLPWPVAAVHLAAWAVRSGRMARRSGDTAPWRAAWGEGLRLPVDRRPLRWGTALRAHRLGGRVLY